VNEANSFAGNLPEALERAKITILRDRIAEVSGKPPRAFRAGRYGVGPNTGRIVRDLGFRVDTSVRSRFDYRAQLGPDFRNLPLTPWRAGPDGALIELPLSTAYVGPLGRWGGSLQPAAERLPPMGSALARTCLFQRIPLTPEGVPARDAMTAVERLIRDGLRLLMFSFHSPSLAPGNTPYVRSEADLRGFYRWWDVMLAHLAQRGVAPASLDQVLLACDSGMTRRSV
jgi:peptidoglycan/xylan/chitin deacetylase (PgdA/CDA1 family)